VVEALGLGANDYVTKPVNYPVTLARIHAQLRTREAARSASTALMEGEPRSAGQAGPGCILGGRYRLESRLGGGSFGTVFRARHLELDRPVAVKVLSRVSHPNAVTVLDLGVNAGGVAYLVMELLEGHSLDVELEGKGRLAPRRCADILMPVCGALGAAHAAGVLHRDIKPSNIFLHHRGRTEVPKILDFGIAKIAGASAIAQNLTVDGSLLGTPAYMAPERFRRGPYGPPSDVYSLGTVLYEMLSGRLPFIPSSADPFALVKMQVEDEPSPLRERFRDVSPGLEALVRTALAKEPELRPSAETFGRRLHALAVDPFTPLDDGAG
jgi:serine/threonine protein kinase